MMTRYKPIKLRGRGSFSLVFEVKREGDKEGAENLAYKRTYFFNGEAIACAHRERHVLRRLREENVISPFLPTLYHAFRLHNSSVTVMTLSSGINFCGVLQRLQKLSEAQARFYVAEVMCAVEALHNLHIVHLDIKPSNVLLMPSGHAMLSDFDRACDLMLNDPLHKRNVAKGTVAYRAPEVENQIEITKQADIWSLGILTAEFVTRSVTHLYEDPRKLDTLVKKGEHIIPNLSQLTSPLRRFIVACLNRKPPERPDIKSLRRFEFFNGVNWEDVSSCRLKPPFIWTKPEACESFLTQFSESDIQQLACNDVFPVVKEYIVPGVLKEYRIDHNMLSSCGYTKEKIAELFDYVEFATERQSPHLQDHSGPSLTKRGRLGT